MENGVEKCDKAVIVVKARNGREWLRASSVVSRASRVKGYLRCVIFDFGDFYADVVAGIKD